MPAPLWPNSRLHWRDKQKPKRAYKNAGWALAFEAGARRWAASGGLKDGERLHASFLFCPPTAARRDLDNCLAALKAAIDGMALALQVDDSLWHMSIGWGPVVKRGAVRVTFEVVAAKIAPFRDAV